MLSLSQPTGFRKAGASGLLVPATLQRRRDVWTRQEQRAMDAAAEACVLHNVSLRLFCTREGCRGTIARVTDDPAGLTLRCDCTDHVFVRGL